jgi:tetratricopeptide (TPR) repeat protein
MLIATSSRRIRRRFPDARIRLIAAFYALAALWSAVPRAALAGDPIQLAHLSEENLPAQDMPNGAATPDSGPAAEWVVVPPGSPSNAPSAPTAVAPSATNPSGSTAPPTDINAAQAEPTPMPSPTDIAPLEVGSIAPQMQISDSSLDNLIRKMSASQPALAASLRLTDQARDEILNHHEDDAIQTLQRAISIDGSNPYAYFYVGRAYLGKKNYDQSTTFFKRAETRFGANPEWLGETLSFEGLANEQSGQTALAIACYQKTLVAEPGNLMARVGLTRLGGDQTAPAVQPVSTSDNAGSPAPPPPDGSTIAPPPNSPPPLPAN